MLESPNLEMLYGNIGAANLQPLWIESQSYVPRQPSPEVVTAHWPAEDVFNLLRQAGQSMPSELADRRVLVCKNPALPPFSGTTQTLYACVQLLLPGEQAAAHRHSQSAFRFVLSGEGAYTSLNGQAVYMKRGDFIITPYWTWHGHANETQNEVIWLDGLDNGIVRMFDATFFELPFAEKPVPDNATVPSPLPAASDRKWRYDWDEMLSSIERVRRSGPRDPSHGYRIRYLDPLTNRDPLPTMTASLGLLPADFAGEPYRSSDSTIFVVARGEGRTEIADRTIAWKENDIFTIPTWVQYRHIVEGADAILFSFSDRNAQERLECWREERNGR